MMPDGNYDMYFIEDGGMTAKWYDALEILDYYSPQFKYYEGKNKNDQEDSHSDE